MEQSYWASHPIVQIFIDAFLSFAATIISGKCKEKESETADTRKTRIGEKQTWYYL